MKGICEERQLNISARWLPISGLWAIDDQLLGNVFATETKLPGEEAQTISYEGGAFGDSLRSTFFHLRRKNGESFRRHCAIYVATAIFNLSMVFDENNENNPRILRLLCDPKVLLCREYKESQRASSREPTLQSRCVSSVSLASYCFPRHSQEGHSKFSRTSARICWAASVSSAITRSTM